jgi:hypothetical protein
MTGEQNQPETSAFLRRDPDDEETGEGEDMTPIFAASDNMPITTPQSPVSLLGWGLAVFFGLMLWALLYHSI